MTETTEQQVYTEILTTDEAAFLASYNALSSEKKRAFRVIMGKTVKNKT